jgi:hypothetical protein
MNRELLERVRTLIAAGAPVDMEVPWVCGTTACIGGWAIQLAGYELVEEKSWFRGRVIDHVCVMGNTRAVPFDAARAVLGLTEEEAYTLFFVSDWPTDLRSDYYRAESQQDRDGVRAAVLARIDRMLGPTPAQIEARVAEVLKATVG